MNRDSSELNPRTPAIHLMESFNRWTAPILNFRLISHFLRGHVPTWVLLLIVFAQSLRVTCSILLPGWSDGPITGRLNAAIRPILCSRGMTVGSWFVMRSQRCRPVLCLWWSGPDNSIKCSMNPHRLLTDLPPLKPLVRQNAHYDS